MSAKHVYRTIDRELSWLSFNERVLQEATDPGVPLGERLNFLAIYSSNLDEFFRVRVASLRSLLRVKKKTADRLGFNPAKVLRQIHRVVTTQQSEFGEIFRGQILPDLERAGILLVDETQAGDEYAAFLRAFFERELRPRVKPVMLDEVEASPVLQNRGLYLVVELWPEEAISIGAESPRYALVEIPTPAVPRFVALPSEGEKRLVMFVDDVIRYNLPGMFPGNDVGASYAIKLTRDAELYLEDEFSGSLVEAIRKSLGRRETGMPSRFLYDLRASYAMVTFMKERFDLQDEDLVPGGRYHNLHDLAEFPRFDRNELSYPPLPPLPHPALQDAPSILAAIDEKDRLIHFPYQSYEPVLRFLDEAASDPAVEEIWITLYRVARDSEVVKALMRAARAGKRVTAFVEVKARFDEASNLHWAEQMEASGVRTLYSLPGLKVHCKLALVVRNERAGTHSYAYLATGNFNEKTARIYADHGLFTSDERITADVRNVFAFLAGETEAPTFRELLVAPFHLRKGFYRRIDAEIAAAKDGRESGMTLKMNSLEDERIIARLYEASAAGVPIRLIIRGICCLAPGVAGLSDGIEARSIVDQFLEHARIYHFRNGGGKSGGECLYLASADWMNRNLSRRVEVAFPIRDPDLRAELKAMLDIQLADDTKARILDERQRNGYARSGRVTKVRSQIDTYRFLQERVHGRRSPVLSVVAGGA
jgi:polyphosphate kinase